MLADATLLPMLAASDMARARSWYHEKLDLKPVQEDPEGGLFYRTGDTRFLLYESQFAGTNQATAASWLVEDVRATTDELRGRGVVFEEYDLGEYKTVDGILDLGNGRVASWFKDSEGNILSLIQGI